MRGLKGFERSDSPAHHSDMTTPKEIQERVFWLKEATGGVPIGAKIGCGDVEADIQILVDAGVDFIALDGFGGGTGATEKYVRENVGMPIIAALPRAARCLQKLGVKGDTPRRRRRPARISRHFAQCLALGADAVYIATSALIAINCQQYRICHTGLCPTGVTTHSPVLAQQLDVAEGITRLTHFIRASNEEIANLTRIVGKDDVRKLDSSDLISLNRDLAGITGAKWLEKE